MKRLLLAALLALAACNPVADTRLNYVIGGSGDLAKGRVLYLVLAKCTDRPSSWDQFVYFCDSSTISAVAVSVEDYQAYSEGDPYPAINP